MDEKEKLRILLSYWIAHNKDHAEEFRDWAGRAGELMPDIQAAADAVELANESLEAALEKLGGTGK